MTGETLFGLDLGSEWASITRKENIEIEEKRQQKARELYKLSRIKSGKENPIVPNMLFGLDIEAEVMREEGTKFVVSYDAHIARLSDKGYNRGLTPQEYISLLMARTEGWIKGHQLEDIAKDVLSYTGEFTTHAWNKVEGHLRIYEFVDELKLNRKNHSYDVSDDDDRYISRAPFYVGQLQGKQSIDEVMEFSPELVNYFFGRDYDDIPKEMREGENKVHIFIPKDEMITPIVFGHPGRYDLTCARVYAGSRGLNQEIDEDIPF